MWGKFQGLLKSLFGGPELFFIGASNSKQVVSLDTRGIQRELLVENVFRLLEMSRLNEFLGLLQFWRNRSRRISGAMCWRNWWGRLTKTGGRRQCESKDHSPHGTMLLDWIRGATPHLQCLSEGPQYSISSICRAILCWGCFCSNACRTVRASSFWFCIRSRRARLR